MLTRAKFLRLSGVAATTLAGVGTIQAKSRSDDGVVRVKNPD
jgi:hypothetical protein